MLGSMVGVDEELAVSGEEGDSVVTEEGRMDGELDRITLLLVVGADDGKVEGVEVDSTEGTCDG